jgi:predicted amidohydrolase
MKDQIIKVAATRTGHNDPPMEANPYSSLFCMDSVEKYADENVQRTLDAFVQAGEAGADLVVSTESIRMIGHLANYVEKREEVLALSERLPGPTSDKISKIAVKYKMICAAIYTVREGDKLHNTTVLIGRDGGIIGKYDKVHLPASEHWHITPGTQMPVFETDIGRIGFATCHDIAFPEHCRTMAINGADIILHPTNGWGFVINNGALGMELLRVRAAENCAYIAASYSMNHLRPDSSSCIIGNKGEILAENRDQKTDGIAIASFCPDYEMVNTKNMWSFFSGVPSERMRLIHERIPEAYNALTIEDPPIVSDCYPEYVYAKTADEIKPISDIYNRARSDEANNIDNVLWTNEW